MQVEEVKTLSHLLFPCCPFLDFDTSLSVRSSSLEELPGTMDLDSGLLSLRAGSLAPHPDATPGL